jgi:multiple sugar transport system ATP-binding protein
MAEIRFEQVSKAYPDGHLAVDRLDLAVADGEFLVLVGPSGCGKSTALRMVAGLEDVSSGRLLIGGEIANDLAPRERNVAMIFQSYALYPHLSVAENMGFALKVRGTPKAEIAAKVTKAAEMLELEPHLSRRPGQLSGGQRQRVAMGRAIVREPTAFLMDEPLSNLDARLRGQMRAEVARLQRQSGVTTIYVTHDQVEAMTMGDRVAVLNRGVLQQLAAPRELYDRPCNLFVATFIGSPPINLLKVRLRRSGDSLAVDLGRSQLALSPACLERHPALARHLDRPLIVGIRPEALALSPAGAGGGITATVAHREDLGSSLLFQVDVEAEPATEPAQATALDELDDFGAAKSAGTARLRISTPVSLTLKVDDRAAVVVQTDQLHFFDPASGAAIG